MNYMVVSGIGNREENLDYHSSYISDDCQYFMIADGYRSKREQIVNYSNKIMIEKINNKKLEIKKILETPPQQTQT